MTLALQSLEDNLEFFSSSSHKLPHAVSWGIFLLTAFLLAIVNVGMVLTDVVLVGWKFRTVQAVMLSQGVGMAALVLAVICMTLVVGAALLVVLLAPTAGGSGLPEMKGYLNGNPIGGFFGRKRGMVRILGIVLVTACGLPVGREGPMVCIGGGIGMAVAKQLAAPYFTRWMMEDLNGREGALVVDEERFSYEKRIACALGGAAGIATAFNAPVGAMLYMFEEITVTFWLPEMMFRAFVCSVTAALCSKGLLNLSGADVHALVIFGHSHDGGHHGPWAWVDMPFFAILGVMGGLWAAVFTKGLLASFHLRVKAPCCARRRTSRSLRCLECALYVGIVAVIFCFTPLAAGCSALPSQDIVYSRNFFQYNCPDGEFNGVATLLLNGAEGAVKHLFSRDWEPTNYLPAGELAIVMVAYTCCAAGVAGLAVPMGAFVPSMLMGSLLGRFMYSLLGDLSHDLHLAQAGVYAMMGSAAVLAGFTHMTMAITMLLVEATQDLAIIAPLMLTISIAKLVARRVSHLPYDETLIIQKCVPYLDEDLMDAAVVDRLLARDMCQDMTEAGHLASAVSLTRICSALKTCPDAEVFPVMDGNNCVGAVPRARLQAVVDASNGVLDLGQDGRLVEGQSEFDAVAPDRSMCFASEDRDLRMCNVLYKDFQESSEDQALSITRLMDPTPYVILDDTPCVRVHPMFTRVCTSCLCVVTRQGEFVGMVTRRTLLKATNASPRQGVSAMVTVTKAGPSGSSPNKGIKTKPSSDQYSSLEKDELERLLRVSQDRLAAEQHQVVQLRQEMEDILSSRTQADDTEQQQEAGDRRSSSASPTKAKVKKRAKPKKPDDGSGPSGSPAGGIKEGAEDEEGVS